jgi:hypothetical protein
MSNSFSHFIIYLLLLYFNIIINHLYSVYAVYFLNILFTFIYLKNKIIIFIILKVDNP